jgi:hypothetical protein
MVILYGTKTYGQVDVVKKRFSVVTEFFHIFYVPLLPIGSRVAFDQGAPKRILESLPRPDDAQDEPEPGEPAAADEPAATDEPAEADEAPTQEEQEEVRVPIPMSGKSVLLGYIRGWGFALTLFCGFLGGMLLLMSGSDPEAAAMFPGFLWTAGGGFVVAMASYYGPWNTASPARAKQLCETIGLDPGTLPNELR